MWSALFAFFLGVSLSFGWRSIRRMLRPDGIYVKILSTTDDSHFYMNSYTSDKAINDLFSSIGKIFSSNSTVCDEDSCDCGLHGERVNENNYIQLLYSIIPDMTTEQYMKIFNDVINSNTEFKNIVDKLMKEVGIDIFDFIPKEVVPEENTTEQVVPELTPSVPIITVTKEELANQINTSIPTDISVD